ncbi:adenosylcobalamin-dependent ribonucleoside-diphosphate reductase [Rubellimicrobium sp. CFH 75288]|uniref:adenosylcobalamin-dependent ribonucleoside-diphosphate reductase n=1 Tax=Rubellimicrobium sp. CFH 75288 TaxID=2697034 RepID=UPI001412FCA4|nr:adenosylcobalamin-dependent ribonucleoside-diphosphate reductase [Rubellimicrobium sp. CFH 75288]NAZ36122.1 adenosylcobalamin-dependent ribonucleoside-diphosphate reductase [Rubellimicrobium sp. CFH 75288]
MANDQRPPLAAPSRFPAPIAEAVWDMKYRLKDENGAPVDLTVEDSWRRVARALASVEAEPARWEGPFYAALEDFRFLPAGRILAGAGTARNVTLFNCFVMGRIEDSMAGIFEALKEAALTMQAGGGIGYDFSTIRPRGAPVRGVGADASGPLSFMDVWDAMCRTILSAGSRRGAMMATLRCDHPDIEDFVAAKADPARLRMFNLSVLVTDAFMAAVEADGPWDLVFGGQVFRTVRARALWDRIMRATYEQAEPGVIFIDRINARNNLRYAETIAATNPCGEQPLPPYGACLLGSVNLVRLVRDPFGAGAALDGEALAGLVRVAVRMMDNVVDLSRFPLPQQAEEARAKRRIGLGVTGLADALVMLGLRYGSEEAAEWTRGTMRAIARAAYLASAELAREKGPFPLWDREAFMASDMMGRMDEEVREAVAAHGVRNALLTSVAPTGTISLYAGNVSSGIEPVFAASYRRKVLLPDGSRREEEVVDWAVALWRRLRGEAPLPEAFVTAQDLTPIEHVRMQAAAQEWVDSSISKTVNVPEDIPFEAFRDVYRAAWEMGCKGCTTYRPNPVTGSVLSVGAPRPEAGAGHPILERPEVVEGATYKLRWPGSEHALYITINDVVGEDGRRRPFEIFVNSKNMEHYAWTVALTRMISAVFRRGGDVSFVVEELKAVFDPRGGAWMGGRYVPSILAAIGGVIERHLRRTGFLPEGAAALTADPLGAGQGAGHGAAAAEPLDRDMPVRLGAPCPACGSAETRLEEGCLTCATCGFSRCG